MTANDPVYWAVLRIEEGDHLFVDGMEMRTREAADEWEPRVERWTKEVMQGIEDRSPRDVATFRTLGRRLLVSMPVGHPYWTLPQIDITHGTTSVECAESNPLSRLHDGIESLKVIADRWRANPPTPTKPAIAATVGVPVIADDMNSVGRPTLKPEIEAAYQDLLDAGEIDFDAPKKRLYEPIREKVRGDKSNPNLYGLGDEAIRKVISPLFDADKNKRSASP